MDAKQQNEAPENRHLPSKGDRVAIIAFLAVGAAIIAFSLYGAFLRVRELLSGEPVPIQVPFMGLEARAPIGPGGAMAPVTIDSGSVLVPSFGQGGLAAALAAAIIPALTAAAVSICLMLLARSVLRGVIFSRGNTGLVVTAGMTALVGATLGSLAEGMAVTSAMDTISGGTFSGFALWEAKPIQFVLLAFAVAIVATAFSVGSRLQRDQEGLV